MWTGGAGVCVVCVWRWVWRCVDVGVCVGVVYVEYGCVVCGVCGVWWVGGEIKYFISINFVVFVWSNQPPTLYPQ